MTDTKASIRRAFIKEYAARDFAAITVKGLCAAAPVARTTFYAYYDNTDDVRREIEDDLVRGIVAMSDKLAGGDYPHMDFAAFMDGVESYIREHWEEIRAFLVLQPNLRFMRKWKDAIKENFRRRYPDKQQAKNFEAVAEVMASSLLSAYTYWLEYPDETSPDEIKPLIERVLGSLVAGL